MKSSLLLSAALLAALVTAGCNRESASGPRSSAASPSGGSNAGPVKVGDAMPEYSAEFLDGKDFTMADQKGKVVLLNVWATWCPPCRAEIPDLQQLHDKYAAQGFSVVGVSVDSDGAAQEVRDFVREKSMTYPVVLDPEGTLATLVDTAVIPTSALVDRDGKIVWIHQGTVSADDPEINTLLAKTLG